MPFVQQGDFNFLTAWPIDCSTHRPDEDDIQCPEYAPHSHTQQTFRPDSELFVYSTILGTAREGMQTGNAQANVTAAEDQVIEYDPIRILPNADPPTIFCRRTGVRRNCPLLEPKAIEQMTKAKGMI